MNGPASTWRRSWPWAFDARAFPAVQPVSQHRISGRRSPRRTGRLDEAIARIARRDPSFHLDRASWTNDRKLVDGYGDVLDPIAAA